MAEELVTIYRFRGSAEANLWKEKLHAHGIRSVVIIDYNCGPTTPNNELKVKASDAVRAKKILKSLRKMGHVPTSPASAWLVLILGIILLFPGAIMLFFSHESEGLVPTLICLVFGLFLITVSVLAMIRRSKIKR